MIALGVLLSLATDFDHQVKIRGHRVELGEVEAYLAEICGSDSVAAVAKRISGWGEESQARMQTSFAAPTVRASSSQTCWTCFDFCKRVEAIPLAGRERA